MSEVYIGLLRDLDVSVYAKPNITANEMIKQRHKLELKKEFNRNFKKFWV
jgi:hypothetical protein